MVYYHKFACYSGIEEDGYAVAIITSTKLNLQEKEISETLEAHLIKKQKLDLFNKLEYKATLNTSGTAVIYSSF